MAANVETITVTAAGRGSVHNTLDGTNADSITVNCAASTGSVLATVKNCGAADMWVRWDGTAAVAAADGTYRIRAGENYSFEVPTGTPVVSLIAGSAVDYSLQASPYGG